METLDIKYGKILSVIKSKNNITSVFTEKISKLDKVIIGAESFAIILSLTKLKKTVKKIESLGYSCDIDYDYGFEFECKMYCNLKY